MDRPRGPAGRTGSAILALAMSVATVAGAAPPGGGQREAAPGSIAGRVFALEAGGELSVAAAKVLVVHDEGHESLVLEITLPPVGGQALWVVRTPGPSHVRRDDPALFEALERSTRQGPPLGLSESGRRLTMTACEEIVHDVWFPRRPIEALASFSPEDVAKLTAWLDTHGANVREDVRDSLTTWLTDGAHLATALVNVSVFEPDPLEDTPIPPSTTEPMRLEFLTPLPWLGTSPGSDPAVASAPEPEPCGPIAGAVPYTVYTLTGEPMATGTPVSNGSKGRPTSFELYPYAGLAPLTLHPAVGPAPRCPVGAPHRRCGRRLVVGGLVALEVRLRSSSDAGRTPSVRSHPVDAIL